MAEIIPTRQQAYDLLCEYTKNPGLIKHALAVEAVMKYFAGKKGLDEEKWSVIGLVHDLDYEMFPDQHCKKTAEILTALNWPADYIKAIMSHAWGSFTDVEPQSEMEKLLYTCDELTGLVAATAIVRPSKSILDMTPKSVMKKWKTPSFAAGVDRQVIQKGAEMLGLQLNDLIADVIKAMSQVADQIGLKGDIAAE